jgi:hypothetical protein
MKSAFLVDDFFWFRSNPESLIAVSIDRTAHVFDTGRTEG